VGVATELLRVDVQNPFSDVVGGRQFDQDVDFVLGLLFGSRHQMPVVFSVDLDVEVVDARGRCFCDDWGSV
jgi:hypothetical protein